MSIYRRIRTKQPTQAGDTIIVAPGKVNFPAIIGYGMRLVTRLAGVFSRFTLGVTIERTVARLLTRQGIGLDMGRATRTGDHARETSNPGIGIEHAGLQDGSLAVAGHPANPGIDVEFAGIQPGTVLIGGHPTDPGIEIVSTTVTGEHESFVITASESTGSDWENVANSEDETDGSVAALTQGLVLVQGQLFGQFVNQATAGRNALDIDKVAFRSHYRFLDLIIPGSTLTIDYSTTFNLAVPVWHNVKSVIGGTVTSENHLSSGEEFDITAQGPDGVGGAWGWSDLPGTNFAVRYNGVIAVQTGVTGVIEVDSTALVLEFSSTEAA